MNTIDAVYQTTQYENILTYLYKNMYRLTAQDLSLWEAPPSIQKLRPTPDIISSGDQGLFSYPGENCLQFHILGGQHIFLYRILYQLLYPTLLYRTF